MISPVATLLTYRLPPGRRTHQTCDAQLPARIARNFAVFAPSGVSELSLNVFDRA